MWFVLFRRRLLCGYVFVCTVELKDRRLSVRHFLRAILAQILFWFVSLYEYM